MESSFSVIGFHSAQLFVFIVAPFSSLFLSIVGSWKMKRSGRQNGRKQPNPNVQLIKLFYQILQALHHLNVMKPQTLGRERTNGFEKQVRLLDSFLRPAQSNTSLRNELNGLNRMWATKIAQALSRHYKYRISELMGMIAGFGLTGNTIMNLSNQALDWGKQKLRRKLRFETIQEYQAIIRSLVPPSPHQQIKKTTPATACTNHPLPSTSGTEPVYRSPRKTTPRKYPLEPQITLRNRFSPLRVLDTESLMTPKKRRISDSNSRDSNETPKRQRKQDPSPQNVRRSLDKTLNRPKPSSPKSNSSPQIIKCLSVPTLTSFIKSRSPSPVRTTPPVRRSLSPNRSPSVSPTFPKQTYAAVVLSPRKSGRVNRHNGQKKDWTIPKVSQPNLIIGDSNLIRITNPTNHRVQIEAYPGAKISHMLGLVQSYQHQEKPDTITFNIGTNERENMNTNMVFQNLKDLLKATKEKFPTSKIFVAKIPVSDTLQNRKPTEAWNLTRLNGNLSKLHMEGVRVLESGSHLDVSFHTDGIHWSPRAANEILVRWMEQLEGYRRDFSRPGKCQRNSKTTTREHGYQPQRSEIVPCRKHSAK